MKDCITNLDELAEANPATYKMVQLRITLPNEPASSTISDSPQYEITLDPKQSGVGSIFVLGLVKLADQMKY